ncbi:MAG: hypothetical protein V1871_03435 [Planctomycetota bacterium]
MPNQIITFELSAKTKILEFFNKDVDADGYIVEKNNHNQRVLTIDGEQLKKKEFVGLMKGSEIFIKKDITSLIKLADKIR